MGGFLISLSEEGLAEFRRSLPYRHPQRGCREETEPEFQAGFLYFLVKKDLVVFSTKRHLLLGIQSSRGKEKTTPLRRTFQSDPPWVNDVKDPDNFQRQQVSSIAGSSFK